MNFGYFESKNKEYVITRPDTPAPWANYLGSPEYGAIISNNAGGYSFVKSGANGRIIRYIFNSFDQPGRYIYLHDEESKDFWSASWQPVGKDLNQYKSECHHGTAYTNIMADYDGIATEALYYVPLDKTHEVWRLKVTNNSGRVRKLSAIGYCEFTNEGNYEQDQVNLQYTLFITKTYFKENRIVQVINENVNKGCINGASSASRFFALAGAKVDSYNGDKEAFIGRYHDYSNPVAVENGVCNNVLNYNSNSCGALQTSMELQPGETKEIAFILGQKTEEETKQVISSYENVTEACNKELQELKDYWHGKLAKLQVKTPSDSFNNMINTWNAYQCFMTFIWSRAASFSYCGLRNGYGYRDTVQDIQGIIHLAPEMALDKIRFMLSAQVNNGAGLPLVKYTHNPGHEDTPDDASYVKETGHPAYRADDALWLFPTVYKYIAETGNVAFLDEVIPYANKEEGTVYDHLKRAIDFSMNHLGNHNMPAGLHADWNDCLRLGKLGESTFVAMQLYYGMSMMKKIAADRNDTEYVSYLDRVQADLYQELEKCYEGDRYIRGYKEDGQIIGSKNDPEANMWLNPQSWAVISGLASKEQAEAALESVHRELNTPYGVRLMAPSYVDHAFDGALMLLFNPSTKENGGIFSQPQGWIILAEALMGHGNRAFEYYEESSPASMNDKAEIRKLEPYCHGQFTESVDSPFEGRSHVHWLTGTASTVMVGCVEGILGIRPDFGGLTLAPSIPSTWKKITIEKEFRGKQLHIEVLNPNGKESGYSKVTLNGTVLESNYIASDLLNNENEVIIEM